MILYISCLTPLQKTEYADLLILYLGHLTLKQGDNLSASSVSLLIGLPGLVGGLLAVQVAKSLLKTHHGSDYNSTTSN